MCFGMSTSCTKRSQKCKPATLACAPVSMTKANLVLACGSASRAVCRISRVCSSYVSIPTKVSNDLLELKAGKAVKQLVPVAGARVDAAIAAIVMNVAKPFPLLLPPLLAGSRLTVQSLCHLLPHPGHGVRLFHTAGSTPLGIAFLSGGLDPCEDEEEDLVNVFLNFLNDFFCRAKASMIMLSATVSSLE